MMGEHIYEELAVRTKEGGDLFKGQLIVRMYSNISTDNTLSKLPASNPPVSGMAAVLSRAPK
jgi:hypothetical protein